MPANRGGPLRAVCDQWVAREAAGLDHNGCRSDRGRPHGQGGRTRREKTKKKHKFIFESVQPHLIVPGLSSLYIHVQNALNADEFSFGGRLAAGRGRERLP